MKSIAQYCARSTGKALTGSAQWSPVRGLAAAAEIAGNCVTAYTPLSGWFGDLRLAPFRAFMHPPEPDKRHLDGVGQMVERVSCGERTGVLETLARQAEQAERLANPLSAWTRRLASPLRVHQRKATRLGRPTSAPTFPEPFTTQLQRSSPVSESYGAPSLTTLTGPPQRRTVHIA